MAALVAGQGPAAAGNCAATTPGIDGQNRVDDGKAKVSAIDADTVNLLKSFMGTASQQAEDFLRVLNQAVSQAQANAAAQLTQR